jgi:hypothetical protein
MRGKYLATIVGAAALISASGCSSGTDTGAQAGSETAWPTATDSTKTYVVGVDIQPGLYQSDGPTEGHGKCTWKRLRTPQNSLDAGDIIDTGSTFADRIVVEIRPTDKAFTSEHCLPWSNVTDSGTSSAAAPPAGGGDYAASIEQAILDGAALTSMSDACAEGIEWICLITDIKTSTKAVAIVTVQITENDKQFGEEVARGVYNFARSTHPELRSVQVNNAEGKVLANKTFG